MVAVTRTLNALYKGVSDQSDAQRLPEQFEEQINGYSSVASGLSRRPNLNTVIVGETAGLTASVFNGPNFKTKNSVGDNIFITYYDENTLRIYNGTYGTHTDINVTGKTYLRNPQELIFKRFGNKIFILNRNKVVNKNTTSVPEENRAIARLKVGEFSGYFIRVIFSTAGGQGSFDGVFAGRSPYDGNGNSAATENTTGFILNALRTSLIADGAPSGNIAVVGDTLVFTPTDGTTAKILDYSAISLNTNGYESPKAANSDYMITINPSKAGGALRDITDLPRTAPDGYVVKILEDNDPDGAENYYYLKYDSSSKSWIESIGGVTPSTGLDLDTLPHALEENGSFFSLVDQDETYQPTRLVGDDTVNAFPSFTGSKLNGMFFYADRLVVFANNNLVTTNITKEGELYDFFKASAAYLIESDRIDIKLGSDRSISNIKYALGQDKSLIVFSNQGQHILSSLDPNEARLVDIGAYEIDGEVEPVLTGDSSVFVNTSGSVSNLFKFEVKDNVGNYHAIPITSHYSKSIKGRIKKILYASNENMLIVQTKDNPKVLHIRKQYILNQQEIQNSWSTWVFDHDIENVFLENSTLFLYQKQEETIGAFPKNFQVLSSLKLDDPTNSLVNSEGFGEPLLDHKMLIDRVAAYQADPASYDVFTGEALFDAFLPTDIKLDPVKRYIMKAHPEHLIAITANGERITGYNNIGERLKEEALYIGLNYESLFVFSKQNPSYFTQEGSKKTESFSKLQLKLMTIEFSFTGKFEVLVEHLGRNKVFSRKYSGYTVGLTQTSETPFKLTEGTFKVPIQTGSSGAKISIKIDDPFPVTIQSVEFLGKLRRIAQRY